MTIMEWYTVEVPRLAMQAAQKITSPNVCPELTPEEQYAVCAMQDADVEEVQHPEDEESISFKLKYPCSIQVINGRFTVTQEGGQKEEEEKHEF